MDYCPNCGQPLDPATGLCPQCSPDGSSVYYNYNRSDGGFGSKLKAQLESPLLLALAIIEIAAIVLGFMNNPSSFDFNYLYNIPVVPIVCAAAFFMVYSASRSEGEMKLGGIKLFSVMLAVIRVIVWITVGILVVIGIVMFISPAELEAELNEVLMEIDLNEIPMPIKSLTIMQHIGLVSFGMAVFFTVMNIFYLGSISKAVKSVLESFETNQNKLERLGRAKVWLYIAGAAACVKLAVGALYGFSPVGVLSNLAAAALPFVGARYAGHINRLRGQQ